MILFAFYSFFRHTFFCCLFRSLAIRLSHNLLLSLWICLLRLYFEFYSVCVWQTLSCSFVGILLVFSFVFMFDETFIFHLHIYIRIICYIECVCLMHTCTLTRACILAIDWKSTQQINTTYRTTTTEKEQNATPKGTATIFMGFFSAFSLRIVRTASEPRCCVVLV